MAASREEVFERVKEEIRAGRSVKAAIAAGYRKGLTAILDANLVTILVAFVLYYFINWKYLSTLWGMS